MVVQGLACVSHSGRGVGEHIGSLVGGLVVPEALLVVFELPLDLVVLLNEHGVESLLAGVTERAGVAE